MRKPRLEDFDTTSRRQTPDDINMVGVVPLQSKNVVIHANRKIQVIASQQASMTARQQDGNMPRPYDGLTASQQASMTALPPVDVLSMLEEKATQKTTVRLPQNLLLKLEETLYLIRTRQGHRLSMNAIFIAALASFCAEFEQKGVDASLYKLLEKTQK